MYKRQVCNCTEKCKAGEVNTACPVCSVNMDSCTGKEATPEEPAEQEQPQNLSLIHICRSFSKGVQPFTTA